MGFNTFFMRVLAYGFLDMALLDCLGSIMVHCVHSDCLHYLGNRYGIFEFITPMIS